MNRKHVDQNCSLRHILGRKAFTIVELVIVIAVISILAAVLIPTFAGIVESAQVSNAVSECKNLEKRLVADNLLHGQDNWSSEGSIFYANDRYFVSHDGQYIELNKFGSREEAATHGLSKGDYKLYKYDNALAGQTISVAAAEAAGVKYITVQTSEETAACVCNYCAVATIDGEEKVYYLYLASGSNPTDPLPLYDVDAEDKAILLLGSGASTMVSALPNVIKNVIMLIADGGGFDNFELANKVKQELFARGMNKLGNTARTTLTNGKLASYGYDNGTGLYLNNFLVGASNTLLVVDHSGSYITDSSAAGTALSSGYKTTYCYSGIDSDQKPRASLTELAQMNGMATGVVSTKSFADATPLAFFTAHSIFRYEYQDTTLQAILSGVDVALVEGTEWGDTTSTLPQTSSHLSASEAGYTVVKNKTEMLSAINGGATKVWGAFLGRKNGSLTYATSDRAADYVALDIDSTEKDEPTLKDMTAAALQLLYNKNDPDGFFLMIEGGALDNVAEGGKLRYAVGEALAFDETFAYCVEWAKQHGDNTIVIATADHDSGGFYGVESKETELINAIITGTFPDSTTITVADNFGTYKTKLGMDSSAGYKNGHTDMPVPIWLYSPGTTRSTIINRLGLPADTAPDKVRNLASGSYYVAGKAGINDGYWIENTAIAPVLAGYISTKTLDQATAEIYVAVAQYTDGTTTYLNGITAGTIDLGTPNTSTIAESNYTYYPATFTCGEYVFHRNSATYEKGGVSATFEKNGDFLPLALFITEAQSGKTGATNGTFYLPKSIVDRLIGS